MVLRTHNSVLSDDEAAHVVSGHSADGIVHGRALVDLVVDVEVARPLPRLLRRALCSQIKVFICLTSSIADDCIKRGAKQISVVILLYHSS